MTIQRKQNRQLWLGAVASVIPDAVIAYVVMRVTESGWVGFGLTFLGLWAVYLAIWLKNSIWSWIVFLLWGKRSMVAALLSSLREHRYPEPDNFENSADGYLQRIATDEKQPMDIRLMAAGEYASLHAHNQYGFQRFMQLSVALDNALEQYKNQFPPKASAAADENTEPAQDDEDGAQVVARVQATCRIASMIAGDKEQKDSPNERRRFEGRIEKALGLARGIGDEFYRSAALHHVVSVLIKDAQLDRAEELASEITVDMIQEKALGELRAARV